MALAAIFYTLKFMESEKLSNNIKDRYHALKENFISKTESTKWVFEQLEENPDSKIIQRKLLEELRNNYLEYDKDVIEKANTLFKELVKEGYIEASTSGAIALKSDIAASSGVSIKEDVLGVITITGRGNTILPPKPWPH